MTDAIEHREMSYLIMLRESGKVILDSHPEMDRYQKLITSRGTPPAQTDQVWWSTSINAFMIYLADRHTHTHSDHNTGSAALQRNAELHIYTKNTDTITVYFKRAANISFTVTCHSRLNFEQSTIQSQFISRELQIFLLQSHATIGLTWSRARTTVCETTAAVTVTNFNCSSVI